jgi:ABC-type transport system substrate-binding protein
MVELSKIFHKSGSLLTICLFIYLLNSQNVNSAPNATPPLSIIYCNEEQPTEKSVVMQIIQAQLATKGIPVKLNPLPTSIFYDKIAKQDYQAGFSLWYIDYNDPEGFLTDFYSKASFRLSKYNDEKFDSLYLKGLMADNEKEKNKYFKKAAKLLKKQLPWIPLYSNNEIFLFRKDAKGFQSNSFQYYDYKMVDIQDIRVSTDIEPQTQNPALTYDLSSKHIVSQSYEGLISMNEANQIVPGLAYEWSFSENKDHLTFKLRDNIFFHDSLVFPNKKGRKVNAADIKFSFERMLKSNSPYSYIFDYVEGIDKFKAKESREVSGFQVLDSHTFRIVLNRAYPTMLQWLLAPAAYIIPKETPVNYNFSKGSIGTGSFVLESYNGSVAKFHAFTQYWKQNNKGKQLPYAKTLEIRIMTDVNIAWMAFLKGELDIFNVPLSLFTQIYDPQGKVKSKWSKYGYREVKLNNLKYLFFSMENSPWGEQVKLRKKISEAIDRQAIIEWIFKGRAREATTVIPSEIEGF